MANVICPTCGHLVSDTDDFCANCGRPRTALQQQLEERSRRTGVPYMTLLEHERARAGIGVLSAQTIGQVQTHLQHIERTLQGLDRRMRLLEERAPGFETAPPLPAVPLTIEAPPRATPPAPVEAQHGPFLSELAAQEPVETQSYPREFEVREQIQQQFEPLFAPLPPLPPRERKEFDLEDLLSGRILAWTGGLAILVGSIFFLSMAFSRGWIGPSARTIIGVTAATVMLMTGAWFFERRERIFGHVLVATGLGVMNISLLAATRLYDLIPAGAGLLAILICAIVAAAIAIRANSQVVAAYGLIAALVAPPLLGADANLATAAFVGAILIGTTSIALFRSWRWLSPLAFLFAAPQIADLLAGDINAAVALLVLAGFWLLNAVAAGGEEFRAPTQRVSVTSATLLLLNAAYLVAMGFVILDGDLETWRGLFLVGAALAHGAIGLHFLRDRGEYHPFGMLAAGTGIAALTMAIPVQLGGPVVPIGWAAEAVALAWIFGRRKHAFAGLYAAVLGFLAIDHLVIFEYPLDALQFDQDLQSTWPFLNANGGTLVYILLAMLVTGYFVRILSVRTGLVVVGMALATYAIPFEMSGIAVVASWATIFVVAIALQRWPVLAPQAVTRFSHALYIPALGAAALSMIHVLAFELRLDEIAPDTLPGLPFTDGRTLTALLLVAAAVVASLITRHRQFATAARITAFAVIAYLVPFELSLAGVVVSWAALAAGLTVLSRLEPTEARAYIASSTALLVGGFGLILTTVAPPARLLVREAVTIDHLPFWSGATAALGAMIVALIITARLYRDRPERVRWVAVLAGALGVYLLSIAVVDEFQSRVGGGVALESLQKQAQVSLSILWAVLGGSAFVAGILRFGPPVRLFGLGLLALATAKVFIIDLAALDTSYRVLSFIGLGILLLVSSYIYQHYKDRFDKGHDGTKPNMPTGQPAV